METETRSCTGIFFVRSIQPGKKIVRDVLMRKKKLAKSVVALSLAACMVVSSAAVGFAADADGEETVASASTSEEVEEKEPEAEVEEPEEGEETEKKAEETPEESEETQPEEKPAEEEIEEPEAPAEEPEEEQPAEAPAEEEKPAEAPKAEEEVKAPAAVQPAAPAKAAAAQSSDAATQALPHIHVRVLKNVKKANCKEKGYTGDWVCATCGETLSKGHETNTDKNWHKSIKTVDPEASTCMKKGHLAGTECTACGAKLYAELPLAEHSYELDHTEAATCLSNEVKVYKCVYGCGTEDRQEVADTQLDHDYQLVEEIPATCTENAKTITKCVNGCDDVKTEEHENTALGHSFTNYVSDGNATCTGDGTKTATCDHDGCTETDTVADVGSATGHSFTNYVSNNDATCTEDGTKTATCDNCDATDTVVDAGSALGHSFTNYVSDLNATYAEDGTKTAKCDRCDATDTIVDEGSKLVRETPDTTATFTQNNTGVTIDVATGEQKNGPAFQQDTTASTNFYGLHVFYGNLANGERAMTVALIDSDGIVSSDITLNVTIDAKVVEGCKLMLVLPDGTEREIGASVGPKKCFFKMNFATGAQLIHLVPVA